MQERYCANGHPVTAAGFCNRRCGAPIVTPEGWSPVAREETSKTGRLLGFVALPFLFFGETFRYFVAIIAFSVLGYLLFGDIGGGGGGDDDKVRDRWSDNRCEALRMIALDNEMEQSTRGRAAGTYSVHCE